MAKKSAEAAQVFCSIKGCGRRVEVGGVRGDAPKCAGHYQRLRRNPGLSPAELERPIGDANSGPKLKPVTFRPPVVQLKALTKLYGDATRGRGPFAGASFSELVSRLVAKGLEAARVEGLVR